MDRADTAAILVLHRVLVPLACVIHFVVGILFIIPVCDEGAVL